VTAVSLPAGRWQATTVNLRPNTRAAYTNLLPALDPMPLADLDPLAVRAWLAGMEAAGVGSEHARQVLPVAVAHPRARGGGRLPVA
jgi:hypothetical protein